MKFYFFKPLPPSDMDLTGYQPFIKRQWFRKHFMLFVYSLQVVLVVLSVLFGVWDFSNWIMKALIFCAVYLIHEILHVLVICRIGNVSLTHSGIFFWLHSDAVMSKMRFWLFMTLPFLALSVLPWGIAFWAKGVAYEMLNFIAWVNAIIAGSDIINSVLIMMKPAKAKFYRGYYTIS